MAATNTALYRDTVELVRLYNTSPAFKAAFNRLLELPSITYKGRPLKLYVKLISGTSPIYKIYIQTPINPQNINELFTRVYLDKVSFRKLEQATIFPTYIVTPEEHLRIQVIESLPEGKNKIQAYEQLINQKAPSREIKLAPQLKPKQESTARKPTTLQPTQQTAAGSAVTEKQLETVEESPIKDARPYQPRIIPWQNGTFSKPIPTIKTQPTDSLKIGPRAADQTLYGTIKSSNYIANVHLQAKKTIGGVVKSNTTKSLGTTTALSTRTLLEKGGNVILEGGTELANSTGGLLTGFVNIPPISPKIRRFVFILAMGLIGFMALGSSPSTGFPTAGGGPRVGSTDINSCQLRRADQTPQDAPIKSTTLAGYFQEAERLTTVPASVLAGIARLENAGFIATAENDHDAFFGRNFNDLSTSCAPHFNNPRGMSSTGALGLMQIQPPTTLVPTARADAYEERGVNLGAGFIGKTAEILTIADFCDPRKSILIAAGFTLEKLRLLGEGDGTKWDPAWTNNKTVIDKIAKSYYGCLKYPTCEQPDGTGGGPHHYGDDLWTTIRSCKVITPSYTPGTVPPADPDPAKLRLAIINEFGINFDTTFSHDYLKWAWEKFWQAKNSKFIELLTDSGKKEIIVTRNDEDINRQLGCRTVQIRGKNSAGIPYPEQLFKVVLIHELSHIIEQGNCTPIALSKKSELQSVINQEGYITRYSQNTNTCVGGGTVELNEDYAEMVSYFLNQDLPEQALGIHPACDPDPSKPVKNPYQEGGKPLHKQLATEILGVITPTPTPTSTPIQTATSPKFSCPVVGTTWELHTPSFQKDEVNGHCGSEYARSISGAGTPIGECAGGGNTRRGKSLDVITGGPSGKDVELPTINGQSVNWQYLHSFDLTAADCTEDEIIDPNGIGGGCGMGYVFKTPPGTGTDEGKNWVLHLLHMQDAKLLPNKILPSGTTIGKTQAIHVHISIGQNIQNIVSQDEAGWKSVDTQLHLCE